MADFACDMSYKTGDKQYEYVNKVKKIILQEGDFTMASDPNSFLQKNKSFC